MSTICVVGSSRIEKTSFLQHFVEQQNDMLFVESLEQLKCEANAKQCLVLNEPSALSASSISWAINCRHYKSKFIVALRFIRSLPLSLQHNIDIYIFLDKILKVPPTLEYFLC